MNQNTNTDNTTGAVAQQRLVPRFWVSWVQPTEDYRPLGYPPHAPVLGWWCSGYDSDDNATLCALIEADDEKAAEEVIKKEWAEWTEWRFIEPRDHNYRPVDRFPLSDWMEARINSGNTQDQSSHRD